MVCFKRPSFGTGRGREWPTGYIGSVSRWGTTVVAAITSTDRMTSVGIDLERRDEKGVPAIHGGNGTRNQPTSRALPFVLAFAPRP